MPVDAVSLEVFKNLLASVAEEMGVALGRTGFSPNIKERKDFSCALFDPNGHMVAQASHIPVHLGAMPASVAAALEGFDFSPGDIIILNDPTSAAPTSTTSPSSPPSSPPRKHPFALSLSKGHPRRQIEGRTPAAAARPWSASSPTARITPTSAA